VVYLTCNAIIHQKMFAICLCTEFLWDDRHG
jgi:hypothetical protein